MDNVLEFLIEINNEYKTRYLSYEQDISRIKEHIAETENKISEIKDSIDESYAVMSSSQTANEVENTELQSLTNLLGEYKDNFHKLSDNLENCAHKVDKTEQIIKEYNENKYTGLSDRHLKDKLELVLKLMKPDPERAKHELTAIIKNICK